MGSKEIEILWIGTESEQNKPLHSAIRDARLHFPVRFALPDTNTLRLLEHDHNGKNRIHPVIVLIIDALEASDFDFLKAIRKLPGHGSTPVYIIAPPADLSRVNAVYELGIAGFIRKPDSGEAAERVVNTLNALWEICEF